jgi:uncharacterized repeat protein (TIGR04042 family)
MPVTLFEVRWPDDTVTTCYSPSTVIKESLSEGTTYTLDDFLARADIALKRASERVAAKYGMACSQAVSQLVAIHARAQTYQAIEDPRIEVIRFL